MAKELEERWFAAAGAEYEARLEGYVRSLGKSWHVPGLLKRMPKVDVPVELAPAARKAIATFYADDMRDFSVVVGIVVVLLFDATPASCKLLEALPAKMAKALANEDVWDETIVSRIVSALAEKPAAKRLAKKLEAQLAEQSSDNESAALFDEVFAPKGWSQEVRLSLGRENSLPLRDPQIRVSLDPTAARDWTISVSSSNDSNIRIYEKRKGKTAKDEIGLPKLDRLAAFPAWLVEVSRVMKFDFAERFIAIDTRPRRLRAPQENAIREWARRGA